MAPINKAYIINSRKSEIIVCTTIYKGFIDAKRVHNHSD